MKQYRIMIYSRLRLIESLDSDIFHDAGVWNTSLSDSIRIEIVSRGPIDLQNKEGPFMSIEKPGSRGEIRSLTKEWFTVSWKMVRDYGDLGCCALLRMDAYTVSAVVYF